jgi:hypothetical protein
VGYVYDNVCEQQSIFIYPTMKMEQTVCSETLAYKIQTPGNYPEESLQHSEHGESLKSSIINYCYWKCLFINGAACNKYKRAQVLAEFRKFTFELQTPSKKKKSFAFMILFVYDNVNLWANWMRLSFNILRNSWAGF